ncbi:hypothetical protein I553_9904 [Mycobacterium xenopi 4042]|uniref:Uncharacterized protein n=1 Tax=Mycobacterium xenopi 4042 TaxID=1299334 RepID=X7YNT6_MYCXE|nr:hypothetical protein I553_9904 [Mycobacterium xenopi 4042]
MTAETLTPPRRRGGCACCCRWPRWCWYSTSSPRCSLSNC